MRSNEAVREKAGQGRSPLFTVLAGSSEAKGDEDRLRVQTEQDLGKTGGRMLSSRVQGQRAPIGDYSGPSIATICPSSVWRLAQNGGKGGADAHKV